MARAKAAVEQSGTGEPDRDTVSGRRAPLAPARTKRTARSRRPARDKRVVRSAGPTPARPAFERRYRQSYRHVDLWSVLKVSLCFYLAALIVVVASGMVLWWIASAAGVVGNVEDFIGGLIGSDDFRFLSWELLRGCTLVGLVLVCLIVVCTVLAAALYNLFSAVVGGIEVTVVEEEHERA